ncbi:unnamed protein product [Hermetia illucens]|uniref:Cytoplasmic tRNA 2-thiolation protein 1 n=1 Tax=Hermetia illucens TaxID=343691 RepID=A0A7R8UJ26_HERIL|nr:unnamed protein product [Hermetia illucens]
MSTACKSKCGNRAVLKRPKTGDALCKECFFLAFETEIHNTIVENKLFKNGDRVAIAASGGKDSTVLAYVLAHLNRKYNYGLNLVLLSIDEGITGYRDDSLETVKRNRDDYGLPLKILSYEELYGWTMDKIVAQIGRSEALAFKDTTKKVVRGICSKCGFVSSQQPCKACVLLEGLNRGLPKLGIGKKSKGDRMIAQQNKELALKERANLVKNDF